MWGEGGGRPHNTPALLGRSLRQLEKSEKGVRWPRRGSRRREIASDAACSKSACVHLLRVFQSYSASESPALNSQSSTKHHKAAYLVLCSQLQLSLPNRFIYFTNDSEGMTAYVLLLREGTRPTTGYPDCYFRGFPQPKQVILWMVHQIKIGPVAQSV